MCAQSYARFLIERICTKSNLIKRKPKKRGCIGGFLERVVIDFNTGWLSAKTPSFWGKVQGDDSVLLRAGGKVGFIGGNSAAQ